MTNSEIANMIDHTILKSTATLADVETLCQEAIDNNFAVMIEFGKLIVEFIYKACIAFLVIAAADYGVTKWKFLKDQKMSFKEAESLIDELMTLDHPYQCPHGRPTIISMTKYELEKKFKR